MGQCFRKKLGIANGLSVAGVSVGQMVFPALVTFLFQSYGVRAGTVVMAALLLHICVTAALMPGRVVESLDDIIESSPLPTQEANWLHLLINIFEGLLISCFLMLCASY